MIVLFVLPNPVNGLKKNRLKNKFPLNSTWMTDSRPGNKTPSVNFSVESDFQVRNTRFLRPEGKSRKNEIRKIRKSFVFLICYFLFLVFLLNPFMGL